MERSRLTVATADHRSESNRSRRAFTSLKSWSALFRSSPRRTPLDGRSLGCLSVLDIPDDPDILRTLPSPARSVNGDFSKSYLNAQKHARPRVALPVAADRDEFFMRQPERPKNALKVRISTPPKRQDVSILATPPRAPLSPMDDFPSAFLSSLEEFSKTTDGRIPVKEAHECSTDQSESSSCSANGPPSDFEGSTCGLQNNSKSPNLRTSSEFQIILNREDKAVSSDVMKPPSKISMSSLEAAKANMGKQQTPESAKCKIFKKPDVAINHKESKKSHSVSTDPCTVSANNTKLANRTIKKISSFITTSPSRGVKQQEVKSTIKGSSIKIPRPWY